MPFFPRSEEEIVRKSLDELRIHTNITQLSPGGKTRFLIETTAREQSSQQALFDSNLLQPYLKFCDGRFLDYFGDMLNVPRIEATAGETFGNNFMFYVTGGNFGDINGGMSITIPAGTVVENPSLTEPVVTPGIEEQPVIQYVTTSDILCDASATMAFGSIRAKVEGLESSLPRNTLSVHDYSSYADSQSNSLKCTNKYAIDNGANRESDAAFRYRLQNTFSARNLATTAAIRLSALSVPGISDVNIVNCEQGPGTFTMYVDTATPTTSPNIIGKVSEAIESVVAEGVRAFVAGPRIIGTEFVVAVRWKSGATAGEIAEAYSTIRENVEEGMNRNEIGQEVVFDEILDYIARHPTIVQVGLETPNEFESVFVYKLGADGVGVTRNVHHGSYITPLYNEKVILETSSRYRGLQFITF